MFHHLFEETACPFRMNLYIISRVWDDWWIAITQAVQPDSHANFHYAQNPKSAMALTNTAPTSRLLSQGTKKNTHSYQADL